MVLLGSGLPYKMPWAGTLGERLISGVVATDTSDDF
jgi:hypothetical protein